MDYLEGPELCRLAIAKGNEENSDWINTVVGLYYTFNRDKNQTESPYDKETRKRLNQGRYSILAIIERLLGDFIHSGNMPDYDMDLPGGFTKKARKELADRAEEFFKLTNTSVGA